MGLSDSILRVSDRSRMIIAIYNSFLKVFYRIIDFPMFAETDEYF
ncbi:hypothetical protein B6N60_01947 [Richelia sinica FACHB-800]|uniref:Uncharacterized protein n=1 Tax=Richelia sinica FACHB-800 TaxID=1357546 RepID=A0A975T890_9NOST|nr:hypothetical protein B6N60_01947 [Richelia sinica FACHB-800]